MQCHVILSLSSVAVQDKILWYFAARYVETVAVAQWLSQWPCSQPCSCVNYLVKILASRPLHSEAFQTACIRTEPLTDNMGIAQVDDVLQTPQLLQGVA